MGILSWLLLGFLAGTFVGMATRTRREGCVTRIAVGILGALVGGSLARVAGLEGVGFKEFTLKGLLVATLGAALLLLVLQAVNGSHPRGPARR